jgi:hypothetical protein
MARTSARHGFLPNGFEVVFEARFQDVPSACRALFFRRQKNLLTELARSYYLLEVLS